MGSTKLRSCKQCFQSRLPSWLAPPHSTPHALDLGPGCRSGLRFLLFSYWNIPQIECHTCCGTGSNKMFGIRRSVTWLPAATCLAVVPVGPMGVVPQTSSILETSGQPADGQDRTSVLGRLAELDQAFIRRCQHPHPVPLAFPSSFASTHSAARRQLTLRSKPPR